MAEPSPDKSKQSTPRNPLVWLAMVIATLAVLRVALPQSAIEALPAMLSSGGRCEMAREQLGRPLDAAEVCAYGIKTADPVSQMFVAEVFFQHKRFGGRERDAEARELFALAEAQLKKKAEAGDKESQAMLGRLYTDSLLQNGAEAGKWLCAASRQGSADAFTMLSLIQGGQMYPGLYEGPHSYETSGMREKYKAGDCKPEKLDNSVIGGAVGIPLCPYKLKDTQDYCSTRGR